MKALFPNLFLRKVLNNINDQLNYPSLFLKNRNADLKKKIICLVGFNFLSGICLANQEGKKTEGSKKWPTFGWSAKYDEPKVDRINLALQTPPNPSNFRWTIAARQGAQEKSALAFAERELVGLVPFKQINFGKIIEPLAVRGFKYEIYYKFDAGGGETLWISGANIKLSVK